MTGNSELKITCRQCGKEFAFSTSEQSFYQEKGFVLPQHCKECRSNRRNQSPTVCSNCNTEITKGAPAFCSACLATAHLEGELEVRKAEGLLDESNKKVEMLETEKVRFTDEVKTQMAALEAEKSRLAEEVEARVRAVTSERNKLFREAESRLKVQEDEKNQLAEILKQKENRLVEIEKRLKTTEVELEKAQQYRISMDGLEPALDALYEKLSSLEKSQIGLHQSVSQLVKKMARSSADSSLVEFVRRIFRPHRSAQPSQ
jgi:hypothetical protein